MMMQRSSSSASRDKNQPLEIFVTPLSPLSCRLEIRKTYTPSLFPQSDDSGMFQPDPDNAAVQVHLPIPMRLGLGLVTGAVGMQLHCSGVYKLHSP